MYEVHIQPTFFGFEINYTHKALKHRIIARGHTIEHCVKNFKKALGVELISFVAKRYISDFRYYATYSWAMHNKRGMTHDRVASLVRSFEEHRKFIEQSSTTTEFQMLCKPLASMMKEYLPGDLDIHRIDQVRRQNFTEFCANFSIIKPEEATSV
jgi:hypothetical protein